MTETKPTFHFHISSKQFIILMMTKCFVIHCLMNINHFTLNDTWAFNYSLWKGQDCLWENCPWAVVDVCIMGCSVNTFRLSLNSCSKYTLEYVLDLQQHLYIINNCRRYQSCIRVDSRFAPSQWETLLQSIEVSHWLGANLESILYMHQTLYK